MAEEACRKDAGVVQYKQVAGVKQFREFPENPVLDLPGISAEQHEPGFITLRRRLLRDKRLGQVVTEIAYEQPLSPYG